VTGIDVRGHRTADETGKRWKRSAPNRAPAALSWHLYVLSAKEGKDVWEAPPAFRNEGRQVAPSPATARTTAHD
jgi:hypothetical protein